MDALNNIQGTQEQRSIISIDVKRSNAQTLKREFNKLRIEKDILNADCCTYSVTS